MYYLIDKYGFCRGSFHTREDAEAYRAMHNRWDWDIRELNINHLTY